MILWLIAIVVAIAAFIWLSTLRANRRRWLRRLNLLGSWELEGAETPTVLEFRDGLAGGRYAARTGAGAERGDWRLLGDVLTLRPDGGDSQDYALRRFENGAIGIDGPGRERHIYVRRSDNVVPLTRRS